MGFLFGVQGRINRGKWWLAALIYLLVIGFTVAIGFGIFVNLPNAGTFLALWAIAGLIHIVILISAICTGAKRLHDRDKSAWWVVVFYLIPGGLSGVAQQMQMQSGDPTAGWPFQVVALVISIWGFIELGCLRGTQGPNRYGPDPLGGS